MSETPKLLRLYLVLLVLFAAGRFLQGARGVSYADGHHVFSIVTLTLMSAFFFGAFCRRWRDYRLLQSLWLSACMGACSQIVVLLATLASYGLGVDTYFTNPRALNAPGPLTLVQALPVRLGGLIVNPILSSFAGALGWALGALLPDKK